MRKTILLASAATLGIAGLLWSTIGQTQSAAPQGGLFPYQVNNVVKVGAQIYQENCAACHGDNLQGEPDWRTRKDTGRMPAPPHDETGHTWHHKDQLLFAITKYGLPKLMNDPNFETDMPAYEDTLTDEEIVAVLSYIKSKWPEEIQKRHDLMNADQ